MRGFRLWAILGLIAILGSLSPVIPPATAETASTQAVEEGIVTLADTKIQYFSRGSGETIILLPGSTLTVGYLDGLAESLAAAGFRVVSINLRGTGKSIGSTDGVTLQTIANDVAGVVKALNTGPVHIAGNDFGNRVARMFAASYPDLTKSVVLLAAGGKIPPQPDALAALQTVFNPAATEEQILAAMAYFVADPATAPDVWATFKSARDPSSAAMQEGAARSAPLSAWWAPPGDVRYLILQGAEDQIAPPQNGAELQQELGDRAQLINVPKAGHLMPIEQPGAAAEAIKAFIASLGSSQ